MTAWHPRASVTPRILLLVRSPRRRRCRRRGLRSGRTRGELPARRDAARLDRSASRRRLRRRRGRLRATAARRAQGDRRRGRGATPTLPVVAVCGAARRPRPRHHAGGRRRLPAPDRPRSPAGLVVREMRRAEERRELRERARAAERQRGTLPHAGRRDQPDRLDARRRLRGRRADRRLDRLHRADAGRIRRAGLARRGATPTTASAPSPTGKGRARGHLLPVRVPVEETAATATAGCRRRPCRCATTSGAVVQWIGADRDVTDHLQVVRDLATPRTTTRASWRSRRRSSAPWAPTAGSTP